MFLPEIKDSEQIRELMEKKFKNDLRFVRTRSIINNEKEFVPFDEKLEKRLATTTAAKAKKAEEEKKQGKD